MFGDLFAKKGIRKYVHCSENFCEIRSNTVQFHALGGMFIKIREAIIKIDCDRIVQRGLISLLPAEL